MKKWERDQFRFRPYQYQDKHCVQTRVKKLRWPTGHEREVIMGFPKDYTMHALPKSDQKGQASLDTRLTLVGNLWNDTVVA